MKLEKFHGGFSAGAAKAMSWGGNGQVEDESMQTKQFSCLKKKRKTQTYGLDFRQQIGGDIPGGSAFQTNEDEKKENFGALNVIWIVLPVINLTIDIALDFIGIVLYFAKMIFNMTYNMIVPSSTSWLGGAIGLRTGKKYCIKYTWFRNLVLILCPPAGVFFAYGLKGWFQIIMCCLATLFYYFPGLAYAIIVINRSEVNSFMKMKKEPSACNDDGGLGKNFFISDLDNKPTCARYVGESCTPEGKKLHSDPMKKDCCANPELINGNWMRLGKPAVDRNGNPITNYTQGEIYCRNDTKKIKTAKGICVWKSSNKPN